MDHVSSFLMAKQLDISVYNFATLRNQNFLLKVTKGWYLVIVAITFNEFLTPTLGGIIVSTGTFSNP